MNQSTLKFSILVLLAAVVGAMPMQLRGGETNKPSTEKKTSRPKPSVTPFHGTLKAVDHTGKTISVGNLVIQITSETKISKEEKPAMLTDGVVGEKVSGAYRKTEDGKLDATVIHFGETEKEKAKAKKSENKAEM